MIVPAAESSDEVFAARAAAGDDAAFEALVVRATSTASFVWRVA